MNTKIEEVYANAEFSLIVVLKSKKLKRRKQNEKAFEICTKIYAAQPRDD